MEGSEAERSRNGRQAAARAPGRLDVMGGIADYSGALVLQMPLAVTTRAGISFKQGGAFEVVSLGIPPEATVRRLNLPFGAAEECLRTYESARTFFAQRPDDHWAAYVLGCLAALRIEEDVPFPPALSVEITSDVPEGKGVSSSAALEVSVMAALCDLLDVDLPRARLARLCQIVENRIAGAPCGIMDQMTAACGRKDHLLALLCQPAELQGQIPVPKDVSIWGIDSGVRHFVGGSDYRTVRTAAAMGYTMIASLEGLAVERVADGRVSVPDDPLRGYLANLSPARLDRHERHLPERMEGAGFLKAFGGIADPTVAVDPDVTYPVRAATVHPVNEHSRSTRFAALLESEPTEKTLAMMGELMYLSHASYTACGLGSDGTDRLVELVWEKGYHRGLFGARITGGGSGGSVAVLASSAAADAVREIADQYAHETGLQATIFEGSSDGVTMEAT